LQVTNLAGVKFWKRNRISLRVRQVAEEIRTGTYDQVELERRLRDLESEGAYFSTQIYSLLETAPQSGDASQRKSARA
jgi:hypothetical protein